MSNVRVRLKFEDGPGAPFSRFEFMPSVPSGMMVHEGVEYALGMTTWKRDEHGWYVQIAAWTPRPTMDGR